MSAAKNRLYDLLPSVYRERDAAAGMPLRALFDVLQWQYDLVEADIAELYDNFFVETSDDWVLPYIADLLGIHHLYSAHHQARDRRDLIANGIHYRRRKGTAKSLQSIASAVSGWSIRVVEFGPSAGQSQHLRNLRLRAGGTVDVRDSLALDGIDGGFDSLAHSIDVRIRDEASRERYGKPNLGHVGMFVWRLQTYPLKRITAFAHGDGRYSFDPLGLDAPLWMWPDTTPLDGVPQVGIRTPLRRAVLSALIRRRDRGDRFSFPFVLHGALEHAPLVACDLRAWRRPPGLSEQSVAVDPELGRLMLSGASLDEVITSYAYAAAGDIGGGPYFIPDAGDPIVAFVGAVDDARHTPPRFGSLEDALRFARGIDGARTIAIEDSRTYVAADGRWDLHLASPDDRLSISAVRGARPCLRGDIRISAAGSERATARFLGLLIDGTVVAHGSVDLTLEHTTVRPKHGRIAVVLSNNSERSSLTVQSCVTGAISTSGPNVIVTLDDSIIDGCGRDAVTHHDGDNVRSIVRRTTILGGFHSAILEASDSIFAGELHVTRNQMGFVRYSCVPSGANIPVPYHSLRADARNWFTSRRYGHAAYAQLANAPPEAMSGAQDGCVMGAFHQVGLYELIANVRDVIQDYLPVGLHCAIYFET